MAQVNYKGIRPAHTKSELGLKYQGPGDFLVKHLIPWSRKILPAN